MSHLPAPLRLLHRTNTMATTPGLSLTPQLCPGIVQKNAG